MPSQYNLNIKAKLDTSQVQQALKNLKLPGNGGGGGGPGGGGNGSANKEITDAARKVNLGALAAGFNRLTGTLNTLSASMTGEGQRIIQTFSEVTSTTSSAIQNVRSFGMVAGTAVTALELFSRVLAERANDMRIGARARETARSISDSEISSNPQAEVRKHIESGNLDEIRDVVAVLRTRLKENEENVDRAKSSLEYKSQAQDDQGTLGWIGENAGKFLGLAPEGYQTLAQQTQNAQEDYDKATAELANTRSLLAEAEKALANAENSKAAADATTAREAEEEAAKNAQRQATLATQTENIIAARRGELSLRKDVENGDIGALQSRLESVQQNIATLESMGPLSENLQSLLQQSYSMQDYLTGTIDSLKKEDSEKKEEKKDLPSWLDGFEDRTNDFFHSIGGSLGENTLQNDEYRVLQEIERLVRESTGYARQTAQSVA